MFGRLCLLHKDTKKYHVALNYWRKQKQKGHTGEVGIQNTRPMVIVLDISSLSLIYKSGAHPYGRAAQSSIRATH